MFSKLDFRPSPPLDGAAAVARRTFQSQPSSLATRFENKHICTKKHIQSWNWDWAFKKEKWCSRIRLLPIQQPSIPLNMSIKISILFFFFQDSLSGLRTQKFQMDFDAIYLCRQVSIHTSRIMYKRQGYSWRIHCKSWSLWLVSHFWIIFLLFYRVKHNFVDSFHDLNK